MQSKAATVEQYLVELPTDRRAAIEAVRKVILKNLDRGYEEGMQYGMIGYYVPHRLYPAGYHSDPEQPLPFACLASQKNYITLYLMSSYGEGEYWDWFRAAWAKTGKKLDMGKCCIRFKKLDDLPLDLIGQAIKRMPAKKYVKLYESVIKDPDRPPRKGRSAARKPAKSPAIPTAKKPAQKRARTAK